MFFQYDIQKLNQAMQDFYNVTGININLLQSDFSWTRCQKRIHNDYCKRIQQTKAGSFACQCSDTALLKRCKQSKKAEMHICHAGLADVAVPILFDGTIIGYLILGQMKPNTDFTEIEPQLQKLDINCEEIKPYFHALPYFDKDKIQSILNVAVMLAKYLLLEQLLQPSFPDNMAKAIAFINERLEQKLSVEIIAKGINCSKSALYRYFHTYFQCTVSEFINQKRVEKSAELLRTTDLSVEEIALATGFSTASYYTRIFKKNFGLSPLSYKKSQ